MKALPLEQRQLVELQQLDLSIARLEHQERTHPALQSLAALQGRATDLQNAIIATEAQLSGLQRQTEQVEEEVERVKARRDLQQGRLEQGKVPIRDMSALEHEIASMDVRISALEDKAVELMEASEKMQGGIDSAKDNAAAIARKESAIKDNLGEDSAAIGTEMRELRSRRDEIKTSLPAAVTAAYESLQGRLGPRVVIEMRDGNLIDAPVELPLTEMSELSTLPDDELYESEETEYLVARTSS